MAATRDWTTQEAKPSGSDFISAGDDEIRNGKVDVRERMAVDHEWAVSETADGRHKKVTIKTGEDPTKITDYIIVYGKDVDDKVELFARDEDNNVIQLTHKGNLAIKIDDYEEKTDDLVDDDLIVISDSEDDDKTKKVKVASLVSLIEAMYPVGSIYLNAAVATNPATLLGFGTWTAFGAGRVPVGVNADDADFNEAQKTGGAKTHALSTAELAAHTHTYNRWGSGERVCLDHSDGGPYRDQVGATSGSTGSGTAHNNLQPYICVFMWRRTA
jgi:hypothetical protein